ncbi:MAG: hypothetical protein AAGI09_06290 [Pseudomonadota bacterium]
MQRLAGVPGVRAFGRMLVFVAVYGPVVALLNALLAEKGALSFQLGTLVGYSILFLGTFHVVKKYLNWHARPAGLGLLAAFSAGFGDQILQVLVTPGFALFLGPTLALILFISGWRVRQTSAPGSGRVILARIGFGVVMTLGIGLFLQPQGFSHSMMVYCCYGLPGLAVLAATLNSPWRQRLGWLIWPVFGMLALLCTQLFGLILSPSER